MKEDEASFLALGRNAAGGSGAADERLEGEQKSEAVEEEVVGTMRMALGGCRCFGGRRRLIRAGVQAVRMVASFVAR